jgi:hypothetical protein
MITLGSRYVDYGLVGGLFLVLNGAILAILGNVLMRGFHHYSLASSVTSRF